MKLADYSQVVTVDQLEGALRQGGFEGVFHYLSGTVGFVVRVEDPVVVAGIRDRGWPQAGIDVPRSPSDVNGTMAAGIARAYGFGGGFRLYLDIEPGRFDLDPGGWANASYNWHNAVRLAGMSPGVYGVDRTVAACANGADTIWRAVPDFCDPASPGIEGLNPAFFAGLRAIQCSQATFNGVQMDISFSQFPLSTIPLEVMNEMIMLSPIEGGIGVFCVDGVVVDIPADGVTTQALQAAGVKIAPVPAAFIAEVKAARSALTGTLSVTGSLTVK